MTPTRPTAAPGLPDAATVLLLRDGSTPDAAIEVFLVERHDAGAFAGMLVFPGGKVDDADRHLPGDRWTGLDTGNLVARFGMDGTDPVQAAKVLGWCVAGVREVFEEVGVLLASRVDGTPITAGDLASPSFLDARAQLVKRGAPWDWTAWLTQENLVLDLGALQAWSRWVTPEVEPRRFDTVFFVAAAPVQQIQALAHDQVEVVASRWLTPAAVLAERAAGTSVVIYPTRRQLADLHGSVANVLAGAGDRDLGPVMPVITLDTEGNPVAQHPTDGTVESVF